MNNLLEINWPNGIRAVHSSQLHSFEFIHNEIPQLYVNIRNYKGSLPLKGFFHVLAEGKLTLLLHITSDVLAPNYNVALNVGEKNARVIQREKLYILTDQSIQEAPGKKANSSIYSEKSLLR